MDYSSLSPLLIIIACVLVLALTIYTFTPALRRPLRRWEQKKIDERVREIEAKNAQLIASGEAVVIKANEKPFWHNRSLIFLLCTSVSVFVFTTYINEVTASCTSKWSLNGQFINAIVYMVCMVLLSMKLIVDTHRNYGESISDGYYPPRRYGYYQVDTVCFKLTPIIRRRLRSRNIVMGLLCISFICFPVMMFLTSKHPTVQDIQSLSRVNGLYQKVCLERLQSTRLLK